MKFPNTSIKVPAIDEQKGSLTIHKYDYSGSEGVAGTGESTDKVPEDAVGLNGVTFKLYKVADIVQEDKGTRYKINDTVKGVLEKTDNYIDLNTDVTKFINEATGDAKSELNISSSDIHQVTTATDLGNDGIAKLTNLDIGVYLVIETDAPAKVTKRTEPFLVSVPTTKVAGNSWNYDIHVYPKNTTSVGQINLKKTDGSNAIAGSKFMLYKETASGVWTRQTADIDGTPFKDYQGVVFNETTGEFTVPETGLSINNLGMGNYKFVESEAPRGYIADRKTAHMFSIDDAGQVTPSKNIVVANEMPKITKEVLRRGTEDDWKHTADYCTTEDVKFRVTVDVPKTVGDLKTYKIEDRFTAGQFDNVALESATITYTTDIGETNKENFGIVKGANAGNFVVDTDDASKEIGWHIEFTPEQKNSLQSKAATKLATKLEIIYTAKLTKNASTVGYGSTDGNENDAKLIYSHKTNTWDIPDSDKGEQPDDETTEINDKAFVYTFALVINKEFSGAPDSDKSKNEATFDVYLSSTSGDTTVPGKGISAFKIGSYTTNDGVIEIRTGISDDKHPYGFASNQEIYLVETSTAKGYNLLKEAVELKIDVEYTKESYEKKMITRVYDASGHESSEKRNEGSPISINSATTFKGKTTGSVITNNNGITNVNVVNKKGFTLPVTGGRGTTMFTVVGLILMAVAVIGLFTSRKKKA